MLDRNGGQIVFHCDGCPSSFETETRNFCEALPMAKAEGWFFMRNTDDEWTHWCPSCRRKMEEDPNEAAG